MMKYYKYLFRYIMYLDTFNFSISFSVPSVCSNIYCTTLSEERMPVSSEAENVSWFEILEQFMDESFDGEEENNSYVVSEEDQLQQDAGELKVNITHDLTPQLRYNYLADKYFYVSSKYFSFPVCGRGHLDDRHWLHGNCI